MKEAEARMSGGVRIETPRLILRPFTAADAGDVYAYARDPQVGPIAGWPPHQDYMESWYIVETVFSQPGVFAMELRSTRRVVGSVGFVGRHPMGELPECPDDEIGYALSRACWGRGLTPEAVEALVRYGFETLGLRRIWCGHYAGNWRSARVIRKCGFRYAFSFTEHVALMHEDRQTYEYIQTREDWRERVHRTL